MYQQVLSQSVATGLRIHVKEADETANFVEMLDKYFDMLNVNNYTTCITKRKKFQQPYRWGNDARLKVIILKIDYLIIGVIIILVSVSGSMDSLYGFKNGKIK